MGTGEGMSIVSAIACGSAGVGDEAHVIVRVGDEEAICGSVVGVVVEYVAVVRDASSVGLLWRMGRVELHGRIVCRYETRAGISSFR